MQIDPDDSATPPTPNSPLPDIHSPDGFTSFSSSGSSDTISGKNKININHKRKVLFTKVVFDHFTIIRHFVILELNSQTFKIHFKIFKNNGKKIV